MKSLIGFGVYYWYVKVPQCGCMERGLEYITFYAQKHTAPLPIYSYHPLDGDKRVQPLLEVIAFFDLAKNCQTSQNANIFTNEMWDKWKTTQECRFVHWMHHWLHGGCKIPSAEGGLAFFIIQRR